MNPGRCVGGCGLEVTRLNFRSDRLTAYFASQKGRRLTEYAVRRSERNLLISWLSFRMVFVAAPAESQEIGGDFLIRLRNRGPNCGFLRLHLFAYSTQLLCIPVTVHYRVTEC